MKGYVKGYYEKRNGKLVWVSPYENSKDKKTGDIASKVTNDGQTGGPKLPHLEDKLGRVPAKPVVVSNIGGTDKFNFVLEEVIKCVKTIHGFEPGEIVKLQSALRVAKGIIHELGYMDAGIKSFFEVPAVKRSKLSSGAVRETAAMVKELTRISRRIVKGTLREKVQRMAETMEEAL
jgi:hypothetical protein